MENDEIISRYPSSENTPSFSSNPVAAEYTVTEYIDPILGLLQSPDEPTLQPSVIDSQPSLFPTTSPPSVWPMTSHPSLLPTTSEPSLRPNVSPTSAQPTAMPSKQPLACPTEVPTFLPTGVPSVLPTGKSTYLVLGGVNLQPSYYNNGNVTMGWETMKLYPDIQAVRIEIEPDQVEQSKEWIRQASEQGYHMVVTYHKYSVLGSDDVWELQAAAAWWQTNYASMSEEAGTFDVNLMNEWGSHSITASTYADAYNTAIATVRTVYSGPLVIDLPGWGQATATAIAASSLISDQNIVYSTHLYPQSYNLAAGRYMIPADVVDLLEQTGRHCIVGEFGDVQPSPVGAGQCDVKAVVEAAKGVGYKAVYGWAWNGDGGSLNMVSPSWSSNPVAAEYTVTDYSVSLLELL